MLCKFFKGNLDNFRVFHNAGKNNFCDCTDNKNSVSSHYLRQNRRSIKTININVMDDSFASMADSLLQKDKPVAVYCRSGKRSKKAAAILSEKGYKVFELDKGFNSWEEAGKEIEK